jgi:ubiquinol-cytochrome c reductase cytochrome c subunit
MRRTRICAAVFFLTATCLAVAGSAGATTDTVDGAMLFEQACSTCHGIDGVGGVAPTLVGVGAAAADFQLTTGRMPMTNLGAQAVRKQPAFTPEQIAGLTAYVASLGEGPPIPKVEPARGDVPLGGELFRANCAACHGSTGTGTALSYGTFAPSLYLATPTQIGEAVRTGPGNMPVFSEAQLDSNQLDSIAAYIGVLQERDDPGGAGLGRVGPIPEGMVGWLVGVVGLIVAARWIEGKAG